MKKMVNGVLVDMSPDEEAAFLAEQQAWETGSFDRAMASLRAERNKRLSDCDWTQIADAPADSLAWANYRQALRDLPQNTEDPYNPIWPIPPE